MESFACKSDCDLGVPKRVVQLLQLEHSTVSAGDRWGVQWAQVGPSCIAGIKLGVGHVGTAHAALEALGNKVGKPVDSSKRETAKRETAKRVPRELPEHLHGLEPVAAASHPVRYYPTHAHTSMHRAYGKRMEARAVSLWLSRPVISPMSCLSTVVFR